MLLSSPSSRLHRYAKPPRTSDHLWTNPEENTLRTERGSFAHLWREAVSSQPSAFTAQLPFVTRISSFVIRYRR